MCMCHLFKTDDAHLSGACAVRCCVIAGSHRWRQQKHRRSILRRVQARHAVSSSDTVDGS
jgi:hypothetical protein